jgi:Uncharacterized conserved protein
MAQSTIKTRDKLAGLWVGVAVFVGIVGIGAAGAQSPPAAPAPFLDARSTPATTRAPLIAVDPASLPDFALFRECDFCPEMVVMPAGSFWMGSPDGPNGEAGRSSDEGPQQNITLRRFAIARFETTWAEWEGCVAAGACDQGPVDQAGGDRGWGRNRRPVINVDWGDAGSLPLISPARRAKAAIAARPRPSGNTPRAAGWRLAGVLAMPKANWVPMLGIAPIPAARPKLLAARPPIRLAFTTCMAMSGNGWRIAIAII